MLMYASSIFSKAVTPNTVKQINDDSIITYYQRKN